MKEGRPTRLMIDDMRDETHVKCELDVIARNYWTGIDALKLRVWDILFLDHDLSSFMQGGAKEKTGYHVMCWLEANPQHLPKKIVCISANPVGRKRIEDLIETLYKASEVSGQETTETSLREMSVNLLQSEDPYSKTDSEALNSVSGQEQIYSEGET